MIAEEEDKRPRPTARSTRHLAMVAAIVLSLLVPMSRAEACACMLWDPANSLDSSDFLFIGTLSDDPRVGAVGPLPEVIPYTFAVETVFKGDLRDEHVEVWASAHPLGCGFTIAADERVAVGVSITEGRLVGGTCRTMPAQVFQAAAPTLGVDSYAPRQAASEEDRLLVSWPLAMLAIGSGATVLLWRGLERVRRRR